MAGETGIATQDLDVPTAARAATPAARLSALEHQRLAEILHRARLGRRPVERLSDRYPELSLGDARAIQDLLVARRLHAGERIVGATLSVTAGGDGRGAEQLADGRLTDAMVGARVVEIATLIRPRVRATIGIRLARALRGPGVEPCDAAAAATAVVGCLEVVDSRYDATVTRVVDDVADNAGVAAVVHGAEVAPEALADAREGGGAAATWVAALANRLAARSRALEAGDLVLVPSASAWRPLMPGAVVSADLGPLGRIELALPSATRNGDPS